MKRKIDLPLRGWLRRWSPVFALPLAFATTVAIVRADVPNTFADGDKLRAKELNDNFEALDARLAALEESAGSPAGTIIAFGGAEAPDGWLPCDGTLLDGTLPKYAALYAAIGIGYGGSTTSEMFNLPDLRGRFLRGWDNGAGNDPEAASRGALADGGNTGDAVGTLQWDSVGSHAHDLPIHSSITAYNQSGGYSVPQTGSGGTASSPAGGAETRPRNVAVNYIIKM